MDEALFVQYGKNIKNVKGAQSLREMEGGRRDISGPITVSMELLDRGYIDHLRPDPARREGHERSGLDDGT